MTAILLAFLITGLINLCYYLSFIKFSSAPRQRTPGNPVPVSIILWAKNQAENLRRCLPLILEQEHPDFEVILVNDASADDTLEVMEAFQTSDTRIRIVNVKNNENFWANKKYALTLGIKKATKEHLVFIDADCFPASGSWLQEMSSAFQNNKSIVIGYSGYIRQNSLLNKLIRFQNLLNSIQYFSYASWGRPNTGSGRNLAYTAKEFYQQKGFASHLHIRGGAELLFVHTAATQDNTSLCLSPEAVTRSIAPKGFGNWFIEQKEQAAIKAQLRKQDRLLLGTFYLSQVLFWAFFFVMLTSSFWAVALGVLALRWILQGSIFYKSGRKLNEQDLFWLFPFLELFSVWTELGIFIASTMSKSKPWK